MAEAGGRRSGCLGTLLAALAASAVLFCLCGGLVTWRQLDRLDNGISYLGPPNNWHRVGPMPVEITPTPDPGAVFVGVDVVFVAFDPGTGRLTTRVSLRMHALADPDDEGKRVTLPEPKDVGVTIYSRDFDLDEYLDDPRSQVALGSPSLDNIVMNLGAPGPREVQLQLSGDPQRFPGDNYRAQDVISAGIRNAQQARRLPIVVTVRSSPSLGDSAIDVQYFTGRYDDLTILVSRPLLTQFYTYLLALSPMLLLAAAGLGLFADRRTASNLPSLELAAAFLALLPLRQVLVPEGISSFTEIDLMLGMQLIAFVAVASIGVALRYLRATRAGAGAAAGDPDGPAPGVPAPNVPAPGGSVPGIPAPARGGPGHRAPGNGMPAVGRRLTIKPSRRLDRHRLDRHRRGRKQR